MSGDSCQVNADSGNVVDIFCMKGFFCTTVILSINAEQLISVAGEETLHGIVAQPIYGRSPFVKMKPMCGIDNRAGMGGMSSETCHDSAHGSMAMNQIKVDLSHEGVKLTIDSNIGRRKRTSDKVDLVPDDAGSVQTVIVITIRGGTVVGGIVDFIPHGL